ncbi:hypothetical protein FACS1894111_10680 [Clostridia bacterium]|nr:hypothetical protein FACS1894111_10680 [Clostridia bacterium]
MENAVSARRLAIVPTLKCTLNCKLCCNLMQKFDKPYEVSAEHIISDIDRIFEIFDYVEWLQFVGGEIFLHRTLPAVYAYALNYKSKFGKLILMTNATIVPRKEELEVLKQYGDQCQVMISDYGKYSYKRAEMVQAFAENDIPYLVKSYHGDMQYYGGWIDNTDFTPFTGSDDELAVKIKACPQIGMENMHCLDGKLHMCSNSCFMSELGKSVPAVGEFVDLNDSLQSISQKREIVRRFYKQPVSACRICSFRNADTAERFPAAQQEERTR